MSHRIEIHGESRSFPESDPFHSTGGDESAEIVVLLGAAAGAELAAAGLFADLLRLGNE